MDTFQGDGVKPVWILKKPREKVLFHIKAHSPLYLRNKKSVIFLTLIFLFTAFRAPAEVDYHPFPESIPLQKLNGVTPAEIYFNTGKPTVLFIISRMCIGCEPNLFFWNRIFKKWGNSVEFIGLIPRIRGKLQDVEYSDKALFPLFYLPGEVRTPFFVNIIPGIPRTVIIKKKSIIFDKSGILNAGDYFEIKQKLIGDLREGSDRKDLNQGE